LGEEEFAKLNEELGSASESDQEAWLNKVSSMGEDGFTLPMDGFCLPETAEEWTKAEQSFQDLPSLEKEQVLKQSIYFWSFFFSSFFNTLSLMVHGTKVSVLVARALTGDEDALLKAIQDDQMLLLLTIPSESVYRINTIPKQ
jgi:hypothetical protein